MSAEEDIEDQRLTLSFVAQIVGQRQSRTKLSKACIGQSVDVVQQSHAIVHREDGVWLRGFFANLCQTLGGVKNPVLGCNQFLCH